MKFMPQLLLTLALLIAGMTVPARAGDADPLFINLSTDEPHRARLGLTFGLHQHENGHPLTVYLSDQGVLLAARSQAGKYAEPQKMLTELVARGGVVLVCPPCMKHYGVRDDDLLPGFKPSNRKTAGDALFRDGSRTLSW